MRTLLGLFLTPFVLLGIALRLFLLPGFVLFVVFFIFGNHSPVFSWALLICLIWVCLEWRELRKPNRGGTGRRNGGW